MTHLYNLPEPLNVTLVTNESRYEIPTKARWIYVLAYGAGGGGGGGCSGAINTQRGGGAGGQAGICSWLILPTVLCPGGALWITPGIGGAGGAADTAGTEGSPTLIYAIDKNGQLIIDVYSGRGGLQGTTASGGAVVNTGTVSRSFPYSFVSDGGSPTERSGSAGGNTGQPATIYYSNEELGGSGGGGGAGCPSGSYTAASGGAIITIQARPLGSNETGPIIGGGLGNATQGGDGFDGYYQQLPATNFNGLIRSYGGTGGGNSNSGTGGRGGSGAIGAGGGGGGAGFVGGAGGRGGNGYAIICWW